MPPDLCVSCGNPILTMCYLDNNVCSDLCRKKRDQTVD